jgi:hypothetical protein
MSAILQFGYDDAQVRAGLDGLANRLRSAKLTADQQLTLSASISSQSLSGISTALQGALSLGGIAGVGNFLSGVVENIGELSDAAATLNELPSVLDRVRTVAADSDVDINDLSSAFLRLEKNLVNVGDTSSPVSQALKTLGLDGATLAALPLDEKIIAIADAFEQNREKGTAVAAVQALLGKGAASLIPLFEQGGDALRGMFAGVEGLADGTIERIDTLGDKVGRLGTSLNNFAGEALDAFIELPGIFAEAVGGFLTDGIDGVDEALRRRGAAEQEAERQRGERLKRRKTAAEEIARIEAEGETGGKATGTGASTTKPSAEAGAATKAAQEQQNALRNTQRALDQISDRKLDLLPDDAKLEALKQKLQLIFQDVQLNGGQGVTDTAGLEKLIQSRLAAGDAKGAEINAGRLNDILALQKQIEGLASKIATDAEKAVEADSQAISEAFDEIVQGWIDADKAAEQAAKAQQRRDEAALSINERIAILDAEADGNDKLARQLRDQSDLRQRIESLKGQGLTPQEATDLAQKEQQAEKRAAEANDSESGSRGGRRKIKGGVSDDSVREKINKMGSLGQFYEDQKTPLRNTFQFPGLDAFEANQPRNGAKSLLRSQNAANGAAQNRAGAQMSLAEGATIIALLTSLDQKLTVVT